MLDVIVVGGGPVGACAAALLARGSPGVAALRVALLEPEPPAPLAADAPLQARGVALPRSSERILEAAGAGSRLPARRLLPYERMRIWHESVAPLSAEALVFDAADAGEPNLGFIAENRLVQTALLAAFTEAGGQVEPAALLGLAIGGEAVTLTTARGRMSARLAPGAEGAPSALRRAAALGADL